MGRNKNELIKLAEKITGQECKDVLTKKDALKKIACHYLGEEKEFASIADCLESIVEHGATGGSGGGSRTAQVLNITVNGDYHTPDGVYYDPINVKVPLNAVGVTMVNVKLGSLTTVGTPVTLDYNYAQSLDSNYVAWVGKEQVNTRDLEVDHIYNYTVSSSGLTFDITLKKESASGGAQYKVTAEFKDRGSVYAPLQCFLIVGKLN